MNRRDVLRLGAAFPALARAQTTHQYETIEAFSDLVIPGAKDAGVAGYLDNLLAASDRGFQDEFSADLAALDQFSQQRGGDLFVRLSPDRQREVLQSMVGTPAFERLKAWTARMYYATEAGFNELNKDGRVPAGFGCG